MIKSLHLPSGVGATCVLKSPFIADFDTSKLLNDTKDHNLELISAYFDPMCQSVFVPGLPLENFVPPIPTALPVSSMKAKNNMTSIISKSRVRYIVIRVVLFDR